MAGFAPARVTTRPFPRINAKTIALEIGNRNARVQALQDRWQKLRARLDLILEERSRDMADLPGGASGLLTRDYKGNTGRMVTRVDSGIVALLSELRAHEQQAAQELSQWQAKTVVEERKTIDATPAAVALAMILTGEQLEELEAKMLAEGSTNIENVKHLPRRTHPPVFT